MWSVISSVICIIRKFKHLLPKRDPCPAHVPWANWLIFISSLPKRGETGKGSQSRWHCWPRLHGTGINKPPSKQVKTWFALFLCLFIAVVESSSQDAFQIPSKDFNFVFPPVITRAVISYPVFNRHCDVISPLLLSTPKWTYLPTNCFSFIARM